MAEQLPGARQVGVKTGLERPVLVLADDLRKRIQQVFVVQRAGLFFFFFSVLFFSFLLLESCWSGYSDEISSVLVAQATFGGKAGHWSKDSVPPQPGPVKNSKSVSNLKKRGRSQDYPCQQRQHVPNVNQEITEESAYR